MDSRLPEEITMHLPLGYQATPGVWLVLPEFGGPWDGIDKVNSWLRAEEWYPKSLQNIIWFGDDGVGNLLGWDPQKNSAILWNPEDGDEPWKEGSINEIWQFVLSDYDDAT